LDSEETTVISAHYYNQLEELITNNLAAYHKKNALQEGISKEELKETLGRTISPKLFNMALRSLSKSQSIATDKDHVRLAGHRIQIGGELDSLRNIIAGKYREAGLNVPSLTDVFNDFKDQKTKAQSIIKFMLRDGELIKINEELCFDRDTLNKLREDYKAILIKDGKATPASFKELTNLSRKYLIPLMEYFDMNKLTVRVGDHRILRGKL
jgi:selenocysteine-specific elongation factor